MKCKEARRILSKPLNEKSKREAAEATKHLLECESCFVWSKEVKK